MDIPAKVCLGEVSVLPPDTGPMDDGRPTSAASVGIGEGLLPILSQALPWPGGRGRIPPHQ